MGDTFIRGRRVPGKRAGSARGASEVAKALKAAAPANADYRERSFRIHGLICAKCGREFDHTNRRLLTVHHKDCNPMNNPPDGSNWENLCVHCHDDEHSRGLLGDHLRG